jgi:hypothetical protein
MASVALGSVAILGGLLTIAVVSWYSLLAALFAAPFVGSLFAVVLSLVGAQNFLVPEGPERRLSPLMVLRHLGSELGKQYNYLLHEPMPQEISRHLPALATR